jgi:L-asparaginase II
MPLRSMATVFARLARPERLDALGPFAERATAAMRAEPYLVGGRRRLDTDLMTVAPDVVAKEGAEALACAGVTSSGLGVAVKIADGGWRATGPALIQVLREIDALSDRDVRELADHAHPSVVGGGRPVGELSVVFKLNRH